VYLIEDCAHQHGTTINGKRVGAFGDIGSFSFQQSKVLTAGEGGAITTSNRELAEKLDALRNCGRRPVRIISEPAGEDMRSDGFYGEEGNFIHSGNYRMTEFQAVMLSCQLSRLDAQLRQRDANAIYLNSRLREIDGISPMRRELGVELQSYFNFVFRYNQNAFKGLPVQQFRAALSAELGCEVEPCYEPLNNCQLYRPLTKNRYKLSAEYLDQINPARFALPVCENAYQKESVAFHHSILLAEKGDLDDIVKAIVKIKAHVAEIRW
jgi:L-glutamine:2-deoxy-scyllo-inosose/3-amino-2,3-dideoxy-scyllo-inosose aminotransferase